MRTSHSWTHFLFSSLDEAAKQICDAKMSDVETILLEFKQTSSISYSDTLEHANKWEIEYLYNSLKILYGRHELIRLLTHSPELKVLV
jgi:hypothetical protein